MQDVNFAALLSFCKLCILLGFRQELKECKYANLHPLVRSFVCSKLLYNSLSLRTLILRRTVLCLVNCEVAAKLFREPALVPNPPTQIQGADNIFLWVSQDTPELSSPGPSPCPNRPQSRIKVPQKKKKRRTSLTRINVKLK